MPYDKVRGDIRVLYAHYRFSDHASTNIVLKDKSFGKEEVWFEGFMDWTFTRCSFSKAFHFGVEGAKLEEDTRGTTENPEPFPGYGSNGLHFDDCTFSKEFDIKDNCVVVFKDCTFSETFTLEDNVRAEFIGCTFSKGITIKTFCDIRFIRCTLGMSDFGMTIEAHCKVEVHNCTHGSVDDYWFSLSEGCQLVLRSVEDVSLVAKYNTIEADDYSEVKMYGYTYVMSQKRNVITLTGKSKFDAFNVPQFSAEKGIVFSLVDSFLFLKDCATCSCGATGQVIDATNSEIRVKDTNTWSSSQNDCIHLSSSKMFLDTFNVIHSDSGRGIVLLEGSEAIFDTGDTIDSGQNMAIVLESGSVGTFKSISLVQSGQSIAIYVLDNCWIKLYEVVTVIGLHTGIYAFYGRVTDATGDLRQGNMFGLNADFSIMEFSNIIDIIGVDEDAVLFKDCTYDFRYVINMTGKKTGFEAQRSKGVLHNTDKIVAELEAACALVDCSGPTEWDQVNDIEGELDSALKVTGNLEIRINGIINITSEMGVALLWQQTGGNAWVSDVQKIESLEESAADITVSAGSFRAEDIQLITAEQKLALNVTVSSGDAHFERVDTVVSEQADAMNIAVSAGALLRFNEFTRIESDMANALTGTCSGTGVFANGDMITTQMGLAVSITGSGAYSRFKLADIGTINSQQPPDDMCEISGVAFVQVYRVGEFTADQSSRYVLYLRGQGEAIGRCEVIDCTNINGNQVRGGLYVQRFGWTEVVCSSEKGSINIQEAGAIVCALTRTRGRIANFSELKDSGDKGRGFYSYGLGASGANIRIENIDLVEGGLRGMQLYCDGSIEIHNVKEIKGEKADSDACGFEFDGEGDVKVTGGSQPTVITSKDNDSHAIRIFSGGSHSFKNVETEVGKGSISIREGYNTRFYNSRLKGTVIVDDDFVQFYDSETTSGYVITGGAVLEWTNCDLSIGQDDGQEKTLMASDSVFKMVNCVVSGSEAMDFDDSVTVMMTVDGGGYSGDITFQRANLIMNASFANANLALSESGILLNSGFDETGLTGGVLSAGGTYGNLALNRGVICTDDSCDDLSMQTNSGVILNFVDIDGNTTLADEIATIFNNVDPDGTVTIGANSGVIGNRWTGGNNSLTTGDGTGLILNKFTSGAVNLGASSGAMLNTGTVTGSVAVAASAAAFLNMIDATSSLDVPGNAIACGVASSGVYLDGSAVVVGTDQEPSGAGQGVIVTGDEVYNVPLRDGTSLLNNGLLIEDKVVHLFNAYGSNGYQNGSGSTMMLGAKAAGADTLPQWTQVYGAQSRAAKSYIIDVAPEIHHNLPGIIE